MYCLSTCYKHFKHLGLHSALSLPASFFRLEKGLIILDKFKTLFIVFLLIDFNTLN